MRPRSFLSAAILYAGLAQVCLAFDVSAPPPSTPAAPFTAQPEVAPPEEPRRSAEVAATPDAVLFPDSAPERLLGAMATFRQDWRIPIKLGSWHWFHVDAGGPNRSGYGIPPIQRGTYFYYMLADPEMGLRDAGPFSKVGVHTELRWRDTGLFRSFFGTRIWTWELYGWVDTPAGRFKAGQIWRRFGLDWDNSFWGNTAFYDGYKLNPDYGLSWENIWKVRDNYKVGSFVQYFFHQDGINGSIAGGDSESLAGSARVNTAVVRVIPTWELDDKSTLSLGVSGLACQIRNDVRVPPVGTHSLSAYALDLAYIKGGLRLFCEGLQSFGVINPVRYVSGGPSHRITDMLAGFNYRVGAVTYRFVYSVGIDQEPSGWQSLLVPGVTIALTKNIDFYGEFVHWDVYPHGTHKVFENGVQVVLNLRY